MSDDFDLFAIPDAAPFNAPVDYATVPCEVSAPPFRAQALAASALARQTDEAWRRAYAGRPMPMALAETLARLVSIGDRANTAALLAELRSGGGL